MSQLWWNGSLMNFFFRDQAKLTLERLVNRAKESTQVVLDAVEEYCDDYMDGDLDTLEETFYEESVEDIAGYVGVELESNEEEEDE